MPSELRISVQAALHEFISQQTQDGSHIALDVLRALRDEASLMMERQKILDTLDFDPFELCKDNPNLWKQMKRIKNMIHLISYSQCDSPDGFTSIHAVVEFTGKDDSHAKKKATSVRLTFSFVKKLVSTSIGPWNEETANSNVNTREKSETDTPHHVESERVTIPESHTNKRNRISSNDDVAYRETKRSRNTNLRQKTHIRYTIHASFDYGVNIRFVSIEVWACGEGPSIQPAMPTWSDTPPSEDGLEDIGDDWSAESIVESMSEKGTLMVQHDNLSVSKDDVPMNHDISLSDMSCSDLYAACVDPDVLNDFRKYTGLKMNETECIYFLMSFPFYEHEFDLLGFLLDSI